MRDEYVDLRGAVRWPGKLEREVVVICAVQREARPRMVIFVLLRRRFRAWREQRLECAAFGRLRVTAVQMQLRRQAMWKWERNVEGIWYIGTLRLRYERDLELIEWCKRCGWTTSEPCVAGGPGNGCWSSAQRSRVYGEPSLWFNADCGRNGRCTELVTLS